MCDENAIGGCEAAPAPLPCEAGEENGLYHASVSVYAPGVVLGERVRTAGDAVAWIDEEFERLRAGRSVSRLVAWFAGANGADCVRFLRAQRRYDTQAAHLYRVEMTVLGRHPMALVDAVRRNEGRPGALAEIVEEYWQPTRAWQFWEYLGPTMTVVAELDLPNTIMLAGAAYRYNVDRELTARLWP